MACICSEQTSKQGNKAREQSRACAREPVPTGTAQYTGQLWFPPLGTNHLNPRAFALAPAPPAGPLFLGARQILPENICLETGNQATMDSLFFCPTQDKLVCYRSYSILLHLGPVSGVAPCEAGC